MARDIPNEVPDEIAFIIRERWGDLKAMADQTGINYATIRSVLVNSDRRTLRTLAALASPLGVSIDELACALSVENVESRKRVVARLLNGMSQNEWARMARVSQSGISRLMVQETNVQIGNVRKISLALDISLAALSDMYFSQQVLSA